MPSNTPIGRMIDDAIDISQVAGKADSKRRRYLGGSQIGEECNRAIWYSFHWAVKPHVDPRFLRIFDRGHREEERMVGWLRLIGVEVEEYDPATIPTLWHHPESDCYVVALPHEVSDTLAVECLDVTGTWHEWRARSLGVVFPEPRQFSWVDMAGHHRGNCDGRARNVPGLEQFGIPLDEWIGLEFKTHNMNSFVKLAAEDVEKSKAEHYAQMQRYMEKMGWRACLYGSVNKNTDDLYWYIVLADPALRVEYDKKALVAIHSSQPPARISVSPSWFKCRWCDYRLPCHYGTPMDLNCRTCDKSVPAEDGVWHCSQWGKTIPKEAEAAGCGYHVMRHD